MKNSKRLISNNPKRNSITFVFSKIDFFRFILRIDIEKLHDNWIHSNLIIFIYKIMKGSKISDDADSIYYILDKDPNFKNQSSECMNWKLKITL